MVDVLVVQVVFLEEVEGDMAAVPRWYQSFQSLRQRVATYFVKQEKKVEHHWNHAFP